MINKVPRKTKTVEKIFIYEKEDLCEQDLETGGPSKNFDEPQEISKSSRNTPDLELEPPEPESYEDENDQENQEAVNNVKN